MPHKYYLQYINRCLFHKGIMGRVVWGQNCDSVCNLQKQVIRTTTHSNYIAHSEPFLKDLNLLNVGDLMDNYFINCIIIIYLCYFNDYMPHLESRETQYNLCPHPLPVPRYTCVC